MLSDTAVKFDTSTQSWQHQGKWVLAKFEAVDSTEQPYKGFLVNARKLAVGDSLNGCAAGGVVDERGFAKVLAGTILHQLHLQMTRLITHVRPRPRPQANYCSKLLQAATHAVLIQHDGSTLDNDVEVVPLLCILDDHGLGASAVRAQAVGDQATLRWRGVLQKFHLRNAPQQR